MTNNHIEGLVGESLNQIKQMLSINTIVGEPIHTPGGDTILPISRVGVGFVAGGSELRMNKEAEVTHEAHNHMHHDEPPFGGGSGGGVSITPIAFLVVGAQGVKVVPLDNQTHLLDKVIDTAPTIIDKMSGMFNSSPSSSTTSSSASSSSVGQTGDNFMPGNGSSWQ